MPESYLASRSGWFNFFYPAEERIAWYGDVLLYCRRADYQALMDAVPCETSTYKGYRACALEGEDLDLYRLRVKAWLEQFDENGQPKKGG